MTLEGLGNLGEFVGAFGVIVSLVYLARQIRDSARIERLNARYFLSQSMSSVLDKLDDDPELQRIWLGVMDRGEEPNDEDRERLGRFLFRYFGQLSLAYGFAEIDPGIRARYEPLLLRFLKVSAVRSWWSRQRELIPEPFRSEVDSLLRTIINA